MCVRVCVRVHVHMCVCVHVYMCVCACACVMSVCLSVCSTRSGLVESYKKKTKLELQRSIKSLKDDNAMYTKMNQELHN